MSTYRHSQLKFRILWLLVNFSDSSQFLYILSFAHQTPGPQSNVIIHLPSSLGNYPTRNMQIPTFLKKIYYYCLSQS